MEVMLRVLFEYMQVKEAGFKDLCYANTVIATIFSLQHGTCISTYCAVVIFYSVLYFRSLSRLVLTRTVKCSKTARSFTPPILNMSDRAKWWGFPKFILRM